MLDSISKDCPICGENANQEVISELDGVYRFFHQDCLSPKKQKKVPNAAERGRPKLGPSALTHRLQIMVSREEFDEINKHSVIEGRSSWCRKAIRDRLEYDRNRIEYDGKKR